MLIFFLGYRAEFSLLKSNREGIDRCSNFQGILIFFFLLLQHNPLERCCVHNAPPVVTNSCLPPGRCRANVLLVINILAALLPVL